MTTMNLIISVSDKEVLMKAYERMIKRMSSKPTIEFSAPYRQKCSTVFVCDGVTDRNTYLVDALEVTISNIPTNDYEVVAAVYYDENIVTMVNPGLYKNMPSQFGLDYTKCDHCGRTTGATKAFVVYNTKTGKYEQIGQTCCNKICDSFKYLSRFMLEIGHVVFFSNGLDDGYAEGGWSPKDHGGMCAIEFIKAIAICNDYRKHVGTKWLSSYDAKQKDCDGTNRLLGCYNPKDELDMVLAQSVVDYCMTIDKTWVDQWGGEVSTNEDGYELSFRGKQRQAAEDELITYNEFFIAWFALEGYLKSLTKCGFEQLLTERNIVKGENVRISGVLLGIETIVKHDYYGVTEETVATIKGDDGLTYVKVISHSGVMDKYKKENGRIEFGCTIKYISYKRQVVGLGGRMSK